MSAAYFYCSDLLPAKCYRDLQASDGAGLILWLWGLVFFGDGGELVRLSPHEVCESRVWRPDVAGVPDGLLVGGGLVIPYRCV